MSDYKAKVNKDCQIKLDTENWLGADCTGGIEILAQKGKIKVDNTLEARLDMIARQILPGIRTKLFGANPSRYRTGSFVHKKTIVFFFSRKFND